MKLLNNAATFVKKFKRFLTNLESPYIKIPHTCDLGFILDF